MRLPLLLAVLVVGCAAAPPAPGAEQTAQIAFVTLEFSAGAVAVQSVTLAEGRLRAPRDGGGAVPPGSLALVVSAGDRDVWADAVPDPLRRRVEYVDADGRLAVREDVVDRAVVTVRVPAVADRQRLAFYRPSEAGRALVASVEVSL